MLVAQYLLNIQISPFCIKDCNITTLCRMVERNLDFDVDQRDRYGRTALMWAAEMNHKDTVETLIDLGSDRKLVEPQGGR